MKTFRHKIAYFGKPLSESGLMIESNLKIIHCNINLYLIKYELPDKNIEYSISDLSELYASEIKEKTKHELAKRDLCYNKAIIINTEKKTDELELMLKGIVQTKSDKGELILIGDAVNIEGFKRMKNLSEAFHYINNESK